MLFTLSTLSLLLAVTASPLTKRHDGGGSVTEDGCLINGISVGDCSSIGLTNILNDLGVNILRRDGSFGKRSTEKGCLINGISILDCSNIDVGNILNGDILHLLSRREWDEDCGCDKPKPSGNVQGCAVNGISILDCSNLNVGDILNGLNVGDLGGSGGSGGLGGLGGLGNIL